MYKKLFIWILLLISVRVDAQSTVDLSYFTTLLQQGKYVQAFNEAYELRKQPYNKQFMIDYIMTKALCGNHQYNEAQRGFNYIKSNYTLSQKQYEFIMDEQLACDGHHQTPSNANSADMIAKFTFIMNMPRSVSFVKGKGGLEANCRGDNMSEFKLDSTFNQSSLTKRLFDFDQIEKAQAYYQHLLGDSYTVVPQGQFLVASRTNGNLSEDHGADIVANLNHELQFFHDQFGFSMPSKLITVFLINDKAELDQLAMQLHGLTIPEKNLGYSSFSDMTLLAIAGDLYQGTLFHELFHLASRADMGDIPGWLDEGVASLYETSRWTNGLLYGDVKNWRTGVIKDFIKDGNKYPNLTDLVNSNGEMFQVNTRGSACYLAFYYALAKHFAIYLQEHKLLSGVITAFHNRMNVFTNQNAQEETSVEVLSRAIGMTMPQLQAEFSFWLAITYRIPEALSGTDIKFILARQTIAIEALKNDNPNLYQKLISENQRLISQQNDMGRNKNTYKGMKRTEEQLIVQLP